MSKLNLTPDLLSDEVRNEGSRETLTAASVLLANIAAELSQKLTEKQFEAVRNKIVETVSFFGEELFPLVTPEPKAMTVKSPAPKPSEVEPDITPAPTPRTRKVDPAVAKLMAKLPAAARKAAGVISPVRTVASDPVETVKEAVLLRATAADVTLVTVGIKLDINEHAEEVLRYTGDNPSEYEKALVLAALWAKDVTDED